MLNPSEKPDERQRGRASPIGRGVGAGSGLMGVEEGREDGVFGLNIDHHLRL